MIRVGECLAHAHLAKGMGDFRRKFRAGDVENFHISSKDTVSFLFEKSTLRCRHAVDFNKVVRSIMQLSKNAPAVDLILPNKSGHLIMPQSEPRMHLG